MNAIIYISVWLISISGAENKEFCDFVFSLKDSVLTLSYLNVEVPKEDSDTCLSPTTTVTENERYGRVYKLISSNLREGVPILYENTITHFPHLVQIDMYNSKVREINSKAFNNLSEVEIINLSNNNIEKVENNAFTQVAELSTLDLSGNKLKELSSNWLKDFPNLKKLNVSENSISDVGDSFSNVLALEVVDLSHNSIYKVDENALRQLSRLKNLDLSYNLIHSFHSNAFVTNKRLRLLNLFNNDLTYIPQDVLESWVPLHEVIILYNPFPCDCHQKLVKWFAAKGVMINKSIQCTNIEVGDIPVCIQIEGKNCNFALSNQYPVLHANEIKFKCYLKQ